MTWSLRTRPARPKVRAVLLDGGFIGALIATDASQHATACCLYATLVDRSAAGLDRLFSLGGVLGDLPREFRRNALAPVLTLRVARQHRGAARRITDRSPDVALSLVMMQRERIHAVATIGHEFDDVNVTVLFADGALQASVSSGTAPTSGQRSTDE